MPAAAFPADEVDRKRALDALAVLDTLPEAFSNAVVSAAAAIANMPTSAISLVDSDRQWFKATCGLGAQETGRDVSFCAHTILQTEPFLVPDALADPRFCENALVTGPPFVRSYAGFPLVVLGQAVGALCVIDDRPRYIAADVIDRLSKLAAGTAAWLADRLALEGSLSQAKDELHHVTFHDLVTGLPVAAEVILTPCAEVKVTHLGEDDGLFGAVDVDPGGSSGDTSDGPQGRDGQSDRAAVGVLAQHSTAILA